MKAKHDIIVSAESNNTNTEEAVVSKVKEDIIVEGEESGDVLSDEAIKAKVIVDAEIVKTIPNVDDDVKKELNNASNLIVTEKLIEEVLLNYPKKKILQKLLVLLLVI